MNTSEHFKNGYKKKTCIYVSLVQLLAFRKVSGFIKCYFESKCTLYLFVFVVVFDSPGGNTQHNAMCK